MEILYRMVPAASSSCVSPGLQCCAQSMAILIAMCVNTGSQIPGSYFTGDGARKDKDGYFWIMGRVDDVINVSGHRLAQWKSSQHSWRTEAVAEAAVVGRPDEIKGQAISAFVTLEQGRDPNDAEGRTEGGGSRKKSARSLSRMIFVLPTCFQKRAAEKSCDVFCESWQPLGK